ncbi:MAG TPA: hypothetical protein VIN09_11730 [Chloroflexota bacterium]
MSPKTVPTAEVRRRLQEIYEQLDHAVETFEDREHALPPGLLEAMDLIEEWLEDLAVAEERANGEG